MKRVFWIAMSLGLAFVSFAQTAKSKDGQKSKSKKLFMDVHEVTPGSVSFDEVMAAHKKDLAVESTYGVRFINFWVDETKGRIYCLASAEKPEDLTSAHSKAHGLLPNSIYEVKASAEEAGITSKELYMDFHNVGPGKVTAEAVAGAHKKDLATEGKYGVHLIKYWLDEKDGVIFCLAQAKDSISLINTHREAHGLVPNSVQKVKQGNR